MEKFNKEKITQGSPIVHPEKISPSAAKSLLKKGFIYGDICGKFWKKG